MNSLREGCLCRRLGLRRVDQTPVRDEHERRPFQGFINFAYRGRLGPGWILFETPKTHPEGAAIEG